MNNFYILEQLTEELKLLDRNLANLKLKQADLNFQKQLLEKLTEMEYCVEEIDILKASLQKTLNIILELACTEKCSLFLIESSTQITDMILSGSEIKPKRNAEPSNPLLTKKQPSCKALNVELEKGQKIQIDFLPSYIYQPEQWDINACFYPAKKVSGDFYDTFQLGKYVGLTIGDVCDKGVGAAMFMALMRSLIRVFSGQTNLQGLSIIPSEKEQDMSAACHEQIQALQAVELTNRYIAENHWRLSMFATLFFGVLDPDTGLLAYINGGHEPLFLIGPSGIKQTLSYTGPAIGIMPNVKFGISTVQFEPGDILVGYTDGVTEGKNPDGELFSYQRLQSLVTEPVLSSSELIDRIKTKLFDHIDYADQFDDITLLAAKWVA